jgi:hypothetical protein
VRPGRRRLWRAGCMRWALVSVGWPGGRRAGVDSPPMSPGRPRNEGRSSSPAGTAPSGRWRKASNLPNHGRTVFNSLLLVWHVNITFFGTGFALFQILRFFACHRPEIGSLADTINPTSFPLARNLSCFGGSPWFFFLFSCFLLPFFLFFSFLRKGF